MTHRFFFKAESGEVVGFAVDPDRIAASKPQARSEYLWHLENSFDRHMPHVKDGIQLGAYNRWCLEIRACAVSKVKRRLYVKAKK